MCVNLGEYHTEGLSFWYHPSVSVKISHGNKENRKTVSVTSEVTLNFTVFQANLMTRNKCRGMGGGVGGSKIEADQ
jgi:hypothetical protein